MIENLNRTEELLNKINIEKDINRDLTKYDSI